VAECRCSGGVAQLELSDVASFFFFFSGGVVCGKRGGFFSRLYFL
jgi:hypothetical protein